MLYYIYDGSFQGLMTAVHHAYYHNENPDRIVASGWIQEDLFSQYTYINTDGEKAKKVYQAIRDKISGDALRNVTYVFLSELEDAGTIIYHYLRLGFKMGKAVDEYLSNRTVLMVNDICWKVGGESHRMLGLIRFRRLREDIYYAPMEPDYNIIGLIAPHFAKRMADQDWVIHDLKRDLAALYHDGKYFITPFEKTKKLMLHEKERDYQTLWKQYFDTIAIKNKINHNLQKQHMPTRYWHHLIETPGSAKNNMYYFD